METKPFSLQSPQDIATDYGGDKRKIAAAMQQGIVDPTAGTLAGMFIDRMRSSAQVEQGAPQTVAEQTFSPKPQQPQAGLGAMPQGQPQQQQQPQPGRPQAMTSSRVGMARGGLLSMSVPDNMFSYAGGGIVSFNEGTGPETGPISGGGIELLKQQISDAYRAGDTEKAKQLIVELGQRTGQEPRTLMQKMLGEYGPTPTGDMSTGIYDGGALANAGNTPGTGFLTALGENAMRIPKEAWEYAKQIPQAEEGDTGLVSDIKSGTRYGLGLIPSDQDIGRFVGGQDTFNKAADYAINPKGTYDYNQELLAGLKPKIDEERKTSIPTKRIDTLEPSQKSAGAVDGADGADGSGGGGGAGGAGGPSTLAERIAEYKAALAEVDMGNLSPEEKAARKKEDMWMTLAQAGFGTAAADSPYALQNIGTGFKGAMPSAAEAMKNRRDTNEKEADRKASVGVDAVKGGYGMYEGDLDRAENQKDRLSNARNAATATKGFDQTKVDNLTRIFMNDGKSKDEAQLAAYDKIVKESIADKQAIYGLRAQGNYIDVAESFDSMMGFNDSDKKLYEQLKKAGKDVEAEQLRERWIASRMNASGGGGGVIDFGSLK